MSCTANHWVVICCVLCVALLMAGCKTERAALDYTVIDLPVDAQVRAIDAADSVWWVAGGNTNGAGFVAQGQNLASWSAQQQVWRNPFYSIGTYDGLMLFGSDSGEVFTSEAFGAFNRHFPAEQFFIDNHKKQPLHEMVASNGRLIAVGGGDLEHGLVLTTTGAESFQLAPAEFDNELRGIAFRNSDDGWVVGNGLVLETTDGGQSWSPVDLESEWYTDVAFATAAEGAMSTYQGGIYETDNGGQSWERVRKSDRHFGSDLLLSKLATDGQNWVAVGPAGSIAVKRAGEGWEVATLGVDDDLLSVFSSQPGQFVIGGQGRLFELRL